MLLLWLLLWLLLRLLLLSPLSSSSSLSSLVVFGVSVAVVGVGVVSDDG